MPRSRSRSRERKRRDKDRRSKSRDRHRDRRSRSRDNKDKDSRSKKHKRDRRSRDRSYDRRDRRDSRERSHERRDRDNKHDSRDKKRRSSSRDERSHKSSRNRTKSPSTSSTSVKPIILTASQIAASRAKANRAAAASERTVDHRESFEISNEFSQEGFEQFSRDHGIDFTNIETDEDRQALHEKMEQVLKEHFAAQGKIYPPPKPEKPAINAATGFVNDGSFLEQFKKMQDEYKQQMEEERKRKIAEERLKSLPLRRRGGKILKTGIVAKTTVKDKQGPTADGWSLYFKEMQKYKNASCDSDAPTRPLVK